MTIHPSPHPSPGQVAVHQKKVNAYFESTASYWKAIYDKDRRLRPTIYRQRQASVLSLVDGLAPRPGSRVLEVGCGAGLMTAALAERGCRVTAMDSSPTMVEMTRDHAATVGMGDRVTARMGDVHALDFPDRHFDLVMAVGLIPWLHSPEWAVAEMARVLESGGHLIMTVDNRARLNHLLDPLLSPWPTPVRRWAKRLLEACGWHRPRTGSLNVHMHTISQTDALLASVGLYKVKGLTVGFGPFSFFSKPILPDPLGIQLHRQLQRLADRGLPGLQGSGSHYVVLARKPLPGETAA